jgi:3-phenylpropionate/trans-cinnamate dioxygenase ferredoxin reductase subunit
MNRSPTFVIVGAGLAGASAAATLRDEGFDGRIVLFGDEATLPYELPDLSKGYLRGEKGMEAILVRDAAHYADHDIELVTGAQVTSLDAGRRTVSIAGGDDVAYDRLLIATGSAARRMDVPGSQFDGIFTLRTATDADAIREAARTAGRAVVIGGGWIGAEVAASLRQMGLPVALIGQTEVPLQPVLGREVGAIYRDLHLERGVELHMLEEVTGFAGRHRVEGVETRSGQRIAGDLVVVGIGAVPRTDLAREAGLHVRDGILVDEFLQSVPGVFAAGDVAAAWHPVLDRRLRLEHWDNAKRQGATAARNMLGRRERYDWLPYFYSDQYDLGMEYVGNALSWDEVVFRGDPSSREFITFWLKDERPVAAMNANIWDVNDDLRAVVASGRRIPVTRLRDVDIPLAELVGVTAAA